MKKLKKAITTLLLLGVSSMCLVACTEKTANENKAVAPDESMRIVLDLIFKDDNSQAEKLNINEKEYEDKREIFEESLMLGMNIGAAKNDAEEIITDEIKENLCADIIEGFKKVEYTIETISEDGDTAEVKVSIKGFDMEKIYEDTMSEVMVEASKNPNISEEEIYNLVFEYMGDQIAEGVLVDEAEELTITVNKKDNYWIPSDSDLTELMSLVIPNA